MSNAGYQVRERKKDVKAKKLRRNKIIPGILYGAGFDESFMIEMDQNELIKLLKQNSYSSAIPLLGLDKEVTVIIKEIQNNSLTGIPIHIDFQAITKGEVVTVAIPVRIIGEEALKGKEILIQLDLQEVELKGPIEKLPSHLEVDVSKFELGDRVILSELDIPEELEILEDMDAIVCIAQSAIMAEEEEEETEEETEEGVAEEGEAEAGEAKEEETKEDE